MEIKITERDLITTIEQLSKENNQLKINIAVLSRVITELEASKAPPNAEV